MRGWKHPLSCTEVRKRLDDYLDQELSSEEAYLMLEHMNGCMDCAAASRYNYNRLAQLREAVQRLSLPTGMTSRLSEWLEDCRTKAANDRRMTEREDREGSSKDD